MNKTSKLPKAGLHKTLNLPSEMPYRYISLLIGFSVVMGIVGCDAALSPQEKLENARVAVGVEASLTAGMLVSAARSCQVIGVENVDRCSQYKGTLIAEQSAQMLASLAVDQRSGYWKKCSASFDQEYCNQLISRAVEIEMRKPRALN